MEVGSQEEKRSLRAEKEGLSPRFEGGADGALGVELGERLQDRTTK